jgi:hypothetical protein
MGSGADCTTSQFRIRCAVILKRGQEINRDDPERVAIDDLGEVILLDPGLAARCVCVPGTFAYRGRSISTINEALLMIGKS